MNEHCGVCGLKQADNGGWLLCPHCDRPCYKGIHCHICTGTDHYDLAAERIEHDE